jgi:hypothetical protein
MPDSRRSIDGTDEADWREVDRVVLCNCNTWAIYAVQLKLFGLHASS